MRSSPFMGLNSGPLLDHVYNNLKCSNDAELARKLGLAPSLISKLRHGTLNTSALTILVFHEATGIPVKDMLAQLGVGSLIKPQAVKSLS